MRAAVVRPWNGDDCMGYTHRASILFDVPDTLWWRGTAVPDAEHQAQTAQCIASAVAVARTTCLPDVQLERGAPSPSRTRVSQRRSHVSTHIAYFESDTNPSHAWVVVYGSAPSNFNVKELVHVSARGNLVQARPSRPDVDADAGEQDSLLTVAQTTFAGGPSVAHTHALSSMLLFLDRPPDACIERTASVTRIIGALGSDAFDWIDLSPAPTSPDCLVLDELFAPSERDGPLVAWLSTRLVLYSTLVLGFDIPRLALDPSSDLAVDLRLRARGSQVHVPPRQAALDAYRQSVLRVLNGDALSGSDMDAFASRIAERVCAHACIK